jgi:hypothetical protein
MSDHPEFSEPERAAYADVDAALRTLPARPTPPGLARAVLARVQRLAHPPFQLTWIDMALGVFGTLMVAFVLLVWSILRQAQAFNLQQLTFATPQAPELLVLGAVILGGLIFIAVAALIALIVMLQTRRR